ncbi:MAG: ABC transporter permease [Jannaschia helgolandensis]|jgi:ABC-2 type transport system permease protein|uniref:Transport permease protein n=1 Tax=Jannaschia helgolandensis TaxID=188906 RepID=A0A1H7J087_9RHOB|nr:ABC transporter permease [Jannaschia helgolandensis]SEK67844.1 ABC-2 type transport system permease protein [Jannaschia helgolandensis]
MSDTTELQQGVRRFGHVNWLGMWTLTIREVRRFVAVWTQTLLAPLATATLFLLVFSLAIGTRRGDVMGVPFVQFLAPGILMMTVIQNSFANVSSSIVISKVQGNIVDTLMPPLSAFELVVGYLVGGILRGLMVAVAITVLLFPFIGLGIQNPVMALVWVSLGGAFLGSIGIIAGVFANKFDQMAAITNFIVTPLSFLSGTFYSIEGLPPVMRALSYGNPIFYLIDGLRFSVLGVSDSSPWLGFAVVSGTTLALCGVAWWMFRTGYRLKS